MREYRAQLDADRAKKLSKGTNHADLRGVVEKEKSKVLLRKLMFPAPLTSFTSFQVKNLAVFVKLSCERAFCEAIGLLLTETEARQREEEQKQRQGQREEEKEAKGGERQRESKEGQEGL